MTEFASNAATSTFIELFVFMTNYEYESRISFDSSNSKNVARKRLSIRKRILTQKDVCIVEKMKDIWEFIKKKLVNAQENQKRHANQKRDVSSEYKMNDMIWLSIKNIKTKRSFRKLNHKWIDSFKIKKILKNACQLNLSQSMKIHDIFHTFLLRIVATNSLTNQIQSSSSSIVMKNEKEKYEINDILNNRYHYDKFQYKVVWTDHFSNRVWYSTKNFDHSKKILVDYHERYSNKTESELRLIASIKSMIEHFYWSQQAKNLVKDILNKMKAKMKENDRKRFNKDSFEKNLESALINTFDRH
jgi:hypothetical protein